MLDVALHKEVVFVAFEAVPREYFVARLLLGMDQVVVERVELALDHTRKPETWVVDHKHCSQVSAAGMPYQGGWH